MDDQPTRRRLVLVLGAEGSGGDALAGVLRTLGTGAPQRRADPAPTGEVPRWVADLHEELLQRCNVDPVDARPSAWFDTGRLAHLEPLRARVHRWLEERLVDDGPELVLRDPRLAWFVGVWRSAALRCDADLSCVTVLRHPASSTGPTRGADDDPADVSSVAGWLNGQLHAERATRGTARAFVRHDDLVADWTVPVAALGTALDLRAVREAGANDIRAVHTYLRGGGPAAGRAWDDVDLPAGLRDLADRAWDALGGLVETPDDADLLARLDEVRADYTTTYDQAAALTWSSSRAAHRAGLRTLPAPGRAVVGRGADRVPHGVRAAVPAGLRRRLRRVLGRPGTV
ncbi:sulfotransferase family protein [Nocardioides dongxiaopingii]|uniref:sulfotransferase family protein n=1 Tax=Nocardioides dongxiaopingii TaxID=2576036 RepID=UPI001FEB3D14|nr:sulfotransferase family protein [Nocardioides dongxiaopingii]